jgi:L-asparaginase
MSRPAHVIGRDRRGARAGGGRARLGDLAAKRLVVLTSRAMTGPVFTRTYYGYSGSEIDLIARNLVPAGYLSGLRRCVKPISLAVPGRIDAVAEEVAPYE